MDDEQEPLSDEFSTKLRSITQAIGSAVIDGTPETWSAAVLELIVDPVKFGIDGAHLTISSPEGQPDIVFPTDELFLATRRLELLYRDKGQMWKRAVYRVWLDETDSWRLAANFDYEP